MPPRPDHIGDPVGTLQPSNAPLASRMGLRDVPAFKRFLDVSPFFSHSSALFCTFLRQRKLNFLLFKQFYTLYPKTSGGGVGIL